MLRKRDQRQQELAFFIESYDLHPIADQLYDNEVTVDYLLFLSKGDLDECAKELSKSKIQQTKLKYAVHMTKMKMAQQQSEDEDDDEDPDEDPVEEEKNMEMALKIE